MRSGFKQTEVGVIPEDWVVEYIEDIAHITTGSRNTQDRVDDGQYPFFVRSQEVERINGYSFDGEAVLTAGDGVGTGKVFHYATGRFDVHQRVYLISDFDECVNGYYFYLYFLSHFYDRVMRMTAKSSVDSVRREMIARMMIAVPPTKAEQQAIAEALGDADSLIDSIEQLLAKKRQLKQGAMQELFTGRRRLPGFSGEWEERQLGDSFSLVNTRNDTLNDNVLTLSAQRGFLRQEDYFTKRVASAGLSRYYLIENGQFAYNRSYSSGYPFGAIKRLTNYDHGVVTTLYICFALNSAAESDAGFYEQYFEKGLLNEGLATVTNEGGRVHGLLNITKVDFLSLPLHRPPLPEQSAIATVLSDMDTEITALETKLDKARAVKQGMMQELLTGRIRLV